MQDTSPQSTGANVQVTIRILAAHLPEYSVPLMAAVTYICLTSVTHVKCSIRLTLCWIIGNISGSTELFGLKLPKLSIHTLVMLQKGLEIH